MTDLERVAPQSPAPVPPTNALAILAFALSFVVAIAGVVCGHIALGQIARSGESGRGFAIAGLVIGYAELAIGLLVVLLIIGGFAGMLAFGTAAAVYGSTVTGG